MLAERNNIIDKLRPMLDYVAGDRTPPSGAQTFSGFETASPEEHFEYPENRKRRCLHRRQAAADDGSPEPSLRAVRDEHWLGRG